MSRYLWSYSVWQTCQSLDISYPKRMSISSVSVYLLSCDQLTSIIMLKCDMRWTQTRVELSSSAENNLTFLCNIEQLKQLELYSTDLIHSYYQHWAPFVPHSLTSYLHWNKSGGKPWGESCVPLGLVETPICLSHLSDCTPSTSGGILGGGRTAAVIREAFLDKVISHCLCQDPPQRTHSLSCYLDG